MIDKKEALLVGGSVVGLAVLVAIMRSHNSASTGGNLSGGVTDIVGGYQTSGTVYVPTSSYDISYNTYKGAVTYASTTTNNQTTATTTYSAPGGNIIGNTVLPAPSPVSAPPSITTTNSGTVNPPTKQTGSTPSAPPPKAPAPKQTAPAWAGALHGGMHYATPKGGWNPNSVVDNLKSHGYGSSLQDRAKVAAAMQLPGYKGTAAQNKILLQQLNQHGY